MSEYDEQPEGQSEGGALRKQLEAALAELKQYKTKERQETLSSTLRDKGFDPRAARLLPKDLEPGDLDGWLKENGDLIARLPEQKSEEPAKPASESKSEPTPEQKDLQSFVQSGQPTGASSPGGVRDELARVLASNDPAALQEWITKQGGTGRYI